MTSGVVHLYDNARPHTRTAARNRAVLEHFNWELFDHPPYSPDLTPGDYHMFTYLKNWLGSQAAKLLRQRHTKIYSPIQVHQFWR
jgi:transposase